MAEVRRREPGRHRQLSRGGNARSRLDPDEPVLFQHLTPFGPRGASCSEHKFSRKDAKTRREARSAPFGFSLRLRAFGPTWNGLTEAAAPEGGVERAVAPVSQGPGDLSHGAVGRAHQRVRGLEPQDVERVPEAGGQQLRVAAEDPPKVPRAQARVPLQVDRLGAGVQTGEERPPPRRRTRICRRARR